MNSALIGFSGFVGSTLIKQTHFTEYYRSTNIHEIKNREFDTLVCAGTPAQKWMANQDPENDRKKINLLIEYLKTTKCKEIILISTVDVFNVPIGVDESSVVNELDLQPYGLHRRLLEKFIENNFSKYLIIRLPGLVGPGLKKNIIFDFLNSNNLNAIDSDAVFQFYPMVNLWFDIQTALQARLSLVHLTSMPIRVADVALYGFGKNFNQKVADYSAPRYDMQTLYASIFGSSGRYQYSDREVIQAIRAYAQSEPISITI